MEFIVDGIKLSICVDNEVLKVYAIDYALEYSTEITDTKVLRPYATLPYHAIKEQLKTQTNDNTLVKKDVVLKTLTNNKESLSVAFSNKASSVFVTCEVEHEGRPVLLILHCNAPRKVEDVRVKIVQIRHKAQEYRRNLVFARYKNAHTDTKIPELVL